MPAVDFNHFNLRAEQPLLNELRDFYVEIVGLKEGPRPPFTFFGYWLYLGQNAVLHLVEAPPGSGISTSAGGTLDHVAFTCTGLLGFEAKLRMHGIPFRRVQVPGTTQQQLFVQDPAGNGVEFNFASGDA